MQKLSRYLLKLSQGAVEKPAYEFKDWALNETKSLISFDSCAWGKGSWVNDTPMIHTIHLHNLAGNFIESWMRFQDEDKMMREVTQNINTTFNVSLAQEYQNTNIYNIHCKNFNVEHIVSTASIDPDTLILNSIFLYRSDIHQPFTEEERCLKEIIFQHLIEASRINWLTNLPNMFSAHQRSSFNALASCDSSGILHVAMPSFVEICRAEWPTWNGPFLPQEVIGQIESASIYIGQSIAINILRMNDVILLKARPKVLADQLGKRELEIAKLISNGDDYKTIASNLSISPSTVKSHTAKIYDKLGINDKAKLAIELNKAYL